VDFLEEGLDVANRPKRQTDEPATLEDMRELKELAEKLPSLEHLDAVLEKYEGLEDLKNLVDQLPSVAGLDEMLEKLDALRDVKGE
jgi:hypothetical protein